MPPIFTRNHVVTREMQNDQTLSSLSQVVLSLVVAVGSALVRPGEVDDGNLEERVAEKC